MPQVAKEFHYTLDEEGVGAEHGPHVYVLREALNAVLHAVPRAGDVVHLTVVMGPKMRSKGVQLFKGADVTFELVVKNLSGLPITADARFEGSN